MINLFEKNAFRSACKNWGTYVGAACIVALGVFIYVGIMDTLNNLEGQVQTYYEDSGLADVFAEVTAIPEAEVTRLREIPGVEQAFGRLSENVRILADGQENIVSVHLLAWDQDDELNRITLSGSQKPDDHTIYVGAKMMEAYAWKPGQPVRLIVDGTAVDFTVAGICYAPEYIYAVPPSGAMIPDGTVYDMAVITKERFEALFSRKGQANELGIALAEGTDYTDVRYLLKNRLGPYGLQSMHDRDDQTSCDMVQGELSELVSMGTVLPFLFMSISVFMLYTVLKKIVDRDRSLIGTMKAMGYSNKKLICAYLKQGIVIGTAGTVIGSILAIPFGQFMFGMYVDFFNLPDTVYHIYLHTRAAALILSLVVSVGAVYLGVCGIVSIMPAEAMRAEKTDRVRHVRWFDSMVIKLGIMEKLGVRAITRSPFRTFLIVLSVAFPFGMSCVVMSFGGVAEQMYYDQFEKIQTYDIQVSLDRYVSLSEAEAAGRLLDGVADCEAIGSFALELRHDNNAQFAVLHALHPGSLMYRIRDIDGRFYEPPSDGIILNRRIADDLHVKVGDRIEAINTSLSREPVGIPVKQVIEESMGMGCYIDIYAMDDFFATAGLSDTVLLQAKPGAKDQVKTALLEAGRITGMADTQQIIASYREMMGSMMLMMDMFSVMSVITGIILIYNISLISIRERHVEFGTLQVLGITEREIGRMVWFEQLVYFLLGILGGFPMALFFKMLVEHLIMSDSYTVHMIIEPDAYGKAFFICMMIVIIAGCSVMRIIQKIAPTDILKARE